MKKIIFICALLTLAACESEVSNPCPKGNGGLQDNKAYYECLDRQFSRMKRQLN
jgi:hypothetical protein